MKNLSLYEKLEVQMIVLDTITAGYRRVLELISGGNWESWDLDGHLSKKEPKLLLFLLGF